MEGDSIRANGSRVVVGIWIEGAMRSIAVSRAAIAARVGREAAQHMSDDERCAFVRSNLPLVVSAARALLEGRGPEVENVLLGPGALVVSDGGRIGDRRRVERRNGDRRHQVTPRPALAKGERRRSDRRKSERRQPAEPGES